MRCSGSAQKGQGEEDDTVPMLAGQTGRSPQGLDVQEWRKAERRVLSISYAMGFLVVLTVVHTDRDGAVRVISFRHASREEREAYHA
jgi:uncharacterized DUF497 family protein